MFPMATPFFLKSILLVLNQIFKADKLKHFDVVQYFILCEQSYDFESSDQIKLRRSGQLLPRGFNPGMQSRNNESAE